MEVKPEDLPLKLPLTHREVVLAGTEYQLEYAALSEEVKAKIDDLDSESVLVQVNINEKGIGFVFEEVE